MKTDYARLHRVLGVAAVALTLAAALGLAACSRSQEKAAAGADATAQSAQAATVEAAQKAATPVLRAAIVTFFTGTVSVDQGSGGVEPELGQKLPLGTTVKTGKDSQCDLQFGSLGTLRVQQNTSISLTEIAVGETRRVVSTKVLIGSVAAKVSKLADSDRFSVVTKSAVCAVRGTEFIVRSGESGATKVSVKEGSVAILPASFDTAPIEAKAAASADASAAKAMDSVYASMLASAPRVTAAQESSVGKDDLAKAAEAWTAVAAALDKAVAAPATAAAPMLESSAIKESLAGLRAASSPVAKNIQAATKATARELDTFVSMTIYQVPSAAEAPAVSGSAEPSPPVGTPKDTAAVATSAAAPLLVPVSIVCDPRDAEIFIDGAKVGLGSASVLEPKGATIRISAKREGYEDAKLEIIVDSESGERRELSLKSKTVSATQSTPAAVQEPVAPEPISARFSASGAKALGASAAIEDGAIFLDAKGNVFRVSTKALVWKAATGNAFAENSSPLVANGLVYVEGDKNLSILSLANGSLVATLALDASDSGLFGRRPEIIGNEAFISASDGLRVLDSSTGKQVRLIALAEGSDMSPRAYQGSILLADRKGSFLRIETASGKQLFSAPLKAVQPVALAATIVGSKAYFADRKGLVVAVDLSSGSILWSKNADEGNKAIFDDIVVVDGALWCYSKGTINVLSAATGERLIAAISGAAALPFDAQGYVWTAMKGGSLVAHDAATGKAIKSLSVQGEFSGRPSEALGLFICPLATGVVVVLNPAAAK
jgi:outer membrane protein assembly factor BamB